MGLSPETWNRIASAGQIAIALAVGAGSYFQWRLAERTERRATGERRENDTREREAAYRALWAEWYRMWAVSHRWSQADLIAEASAGLLNPSDILPKDWPSATGHLAKLGSLPSYLGGYAFVLAHDAAELARRLNAETARLPEFTRTQRQHLTGFVESMTPALRNVEASLKSKAAEVSLLLQDALDHSGDVSDRREYKFNDVLHSQTAGRIRDQLVARHLTTESAKMATMTVRSDEDTSDDSPA